jgi:hypothetical protein
MKTPSDTKKTSIDTMLHKLYSSAEKTKVLCSHCNKDVVVGPDFNQLAKAMALILQYEKIKKGGDGNGDETPDFFKEETKDGGTE